MYRFGRSLLVIGTLSVPGCTVARSLLHRPGPRDAASTAASATAAAGDAPPRLPDDGMTSELHRAFQGQIVFSTAEIPKDGADESALGAEFYADELIYGRAYLPHSVENEPVIDDRGALVRTETRGYIVKLFVDGREIQDRLESRAVSSERRASTTLQIWPHPAPSAEPTPRVWVQTINALAPGDHEIRLELWAHDRWRKSRAALARGTLTLHKTAGQSVGVGRTFADLDRGMTDDALSTEMLGSARYFAKKEGWKETMAEVAIRSKDWIEVRHPQLRHLIARRLQTWVRADWPDGRCTAQEMLFEQKIKRGKPDGPLYVGSSGDQVLLDCGAAQAVASTDPWKGRKRARPSHTAVATAEASKGAAPAARATPEPPTPPSPTPSGPATSPSPVMAAATTDDMGAESAGIAASTATRPAHAPGRFSLGVGVAANTLALDGVASYANVSARLSRVELGVGATWPLNTLGFVRVALLTGRFEIAPMISASLLAESEMTTSFALAGGLSTAYLLHTGGVSAGLRLEALVSYNPDTARLAVPVIGSTYVRF